MEKILQIASKFEMFTSLDGFSGYNQVLVAELDRFKMTFKMKWGTFAIQHMPFGLINVGTLLKGKVHCFQRVYFSKRGIVFG